jgi:hypothetical protein
VVDALVTNVNKMGFFATVGPLQIFTSVHLLPVDFKFQPDSNPAEYASADGSVSLQGCCSQHSSALTVCVADHREGKEGAAADRRHAHRRQRDREWRRVRAVQPG